MFVIGGGTILGLGILSEKIELNPLVIVGALLSATLVVITLLALSEAIKVIIDIENNTRAGVMRNKRSEHAE